MIWRSLPWCLDLARLDLALFKIFLKAGSLWNTRLMDFSIMDIGQRAKIFIKYPWKHQWKRAGTWVSFSIVLEESCHEEALSFRQSSAQALIQSLIQSLTQNRVQFPWKHSWVSWRMDERLLVCSCRIWRYSVVIWRVLGSTLCHFDKCYDWFFHAIFCRDFWYVEWILHLMAA